MEFFLEVLINLLCAPGWWLAAEEGRRNAEAREQRLRAREAEKSAPPRPVRRIVLPEPTPSAHYVGPGFVARVGPGSQCQVCGSPLTRNVVSSAGCATLHHQECWDYVGGCSTYGCARGGRRRSA
jgi:hypothetical protein